MMHALVDRTRDMLREGAPLSGTVDDGLRVTLDLFRKGGDAILDGIAAQDYDVLRGRPVVTRRKKLMLLLGALIGKIRTRRSTGVRPA
jgi:phytoene/squalene synthetase